MTQSQALALLKTGSHVFLTGEPGSGKTYVTQEYVALLRAQGIEVAVTASTGIAATQIGGMTIHSWSGIGVKTKLDKQDLEHIAKSKNVKTHILRARVLVIDEISMLSAQTLTSVDAVCRKIKKSELPFGGLQVVFVGDFFQLPPVVRHENALSAQQMLLQETPAHFCYDSRVWKQMAPKVCYLTEQHRQDDREYLNILSAIRCNVFNSSHLKKLQTRKIEYKDAPDDVPKLFAHNSAVDHINSEVLGRLSGAARVFTMTSQGNDHAIAAMQKACLSPVELQVKVGAAVMFTKNNPKEGFVNGTLGTLEKFDTHTGYPSVKTRRGRLIDVEPMDWILEENGEIRAKITQLPLRLAWALTVHKSQGMSLDAAVVDLATVFEFGQGYVALSRIRRLAGLFLLGWNERAFQVHPEVLAQDRQFRMESESALKESMQKKGGELVYGASVSVAYRPWDEDDDTELRELYLDGATVSSLAKVFSRTSGSIRSRLKKNNLIEKK